MGVLELLAGVLGGFAVGAVATALVWRWIVRRSLARAQVAERRARSAERLAEVGAMTGGLAHEIKNPLSTIGLNAQLLQESIEELPIDADERGRLGRRLGTLRREVERLRGILADFLEFAGELRLERRPTNVQALVEELADFFHPQAAQQGVRLRVDPGEDGSLGAQIDGPHVKQALLNLMLNAVQAMAGAGGSDRPRELILRVRPRLDPDGARMVALHVIDTGPGIAQEMLAGIFKPYYTTKAGGTGLGLPTARRIAEAHGGRVEVHTEIGKGSDFAVILPATAQPSPGAQARATPSTS